MSKRYIYIARFEHGEPALLKALVLEEQGGVLKLADLDNREVLLGEWSGYWDFVDTEIHACFDSEIAATCYLVAESGRRLFWGRVGEQIRGHK